jgi:hypothetical protein
MNIIGNYREEGYAQLEGLIAPEISSALLDQFWADLKESKVPVSFTQRPGLLKKGSMELHGSDYRPINAFLWGLTPMISFLAGEELLPAYAFFRIYQKGDVLRVHADRQACEHSLSLTIGYSEASIWPFFVAQSDASTPSGYADDFEGGGYSKLTMQPGDAVLYRGITRRHGRIEPNPNAWSAHLFLHWVGKYGPNRDCAFESPAGR